MNIKNKTPGIDHILEDLSKKSVFYIQSKKINSEKILKCLKTALYQENIVNLENLTICRLESLLNTITAKKIMIDRLKVNENEKKRIYELEIQVEKYTQKAIPLVKEIVRTDQTEIIMQ